MTLRLLVVAVIATLGFGDLALAKSDKAKRLPPGLHHPAGHGMTLPPGWQQRLHTGSTVDMDVYEQSTVVQRDRKSGTMTIKPEGKRIKIMQNTHEIIDILDSL